MTDAQKLMADVLAAHQGYCVTEEESVPPFLVRCDGNGECDGCSWDQLVYSYDDSAAAYRAHVAAEVDKALGGLTRVTRDHDEWDLPVNHVRWVSGWSEENQ